MNQDIVTIRTWLGSGSINIFGRPFAGKDTQGRILAELFDGVLLGGGEIIRGSIIPEQVKEHLRKGLLIPTDDYIKIVLPYLRQEAYDSKLLILNSVGRWHGEEEGVIEATETAHHPLKAVIYLSLDDDVVLHRLQALRDVNDRGTRHDDTKEVLETRLHEFREKTLPVIDTYREKGLLIEIDANQSPAKVTESILTALRAASDNDHGH